MKADPARVERWSAQLGAVAWAALSLSATAGVSPLGLIELLFLLGPLVIVPVGLLVARKHEPWPPSALLDAALAWLQPAGAVCAAASFWLEKGWAAAALAGAWLLVCGLVALPAAARLLRVRLPSTAEACFLLARPYLPVGGAWFVLSRWGATPLGFGEPIVLLTAVHFHFAGFASALIAGASAQTLESARGRLSLFTRSTVWVVILGPGLLAAGFLVSPLLQTVFALLLALGLLSFAGTLFASLPLVPGSTPRVLLAVSAIALCFAMTLVGVYAVGEYTGNYWLVIPQMARWHGLANALGFSLCGLLAWQLAETMKETR